MALFGGNEKKTNATNELMQKLSSQDYLERLMHEILVKAGKEPAGKNDEGQDYFDTSNEWLTKCQSYYDSCKRTVVIEEDLFGVKWADYHTENVLGADGKSYPKKVEDLHESIGYRYTNDGYKPLNAYKTNGVFIGTDEVLKCWAEVIKERMQALFPELNFQSVTSSKGSAKFDYYVPELKWKDWF